MKQEKKLASKKISPNKIHAILYGRIGGGSERALSEQLQECRSFAKAKGWIVEKGSWYKDVYSSSLEAYTECPGLLEVLEHIDKFPERTFVVVVSDLTRISRKKANLEAYCTALHLRGVSLEVVNDSDGKNLTKQLQVDIAEAFNRYEKDRQCQREVQVFKEEVLKSLFSFGV